MKSSLLFAVCLLAALVPASLQAALPEDRVVAAIYRHLDMEIPPLDQVPAATVFERKSMIRSMKRLIPAQYAGRFKNRHERFEWFTMQDLKRSLKGDPPLSPLVCRRHPHRIVFARLIDLTARPLEEELASPYALSCPAAYRDCLKRMARAARQAERLEHEAGSGDTFKLQPYQLMSAFREGVIIADELSFLDAYFLRETGMSWHWEAQRVERMVTRGYEHIRSHLADYPLLVEFVKGCIRATDDDQKLEQYRLLIDELFVEAWGMVRQDDLRLLTVSFDERQGILHYLNSLLLEREAWRNDHPGRDQDRYGRFFAAASLSPDPSRLPEDARSLLERLNAKRADVLSFITPHVSERKGEDPFSSHVDSVAYFWKGCDEDHRTFFRKERDLEEINGKFDQLINARIGLPASLYLDLMAARMEHYIRSNHERLARLVRPDVDEILLLNRKTAVMLEKDNTFDSMSSEERREYVRQWEDINRQRDALDLDIRRHLIASWKKDGLPAWLRELPDRMVADRLQYPVSPFH